MWDPVWSLTPKLWALSWLSPEYQELGRYPSTMRCCSQKQIKTESYTERQILSLIFSRNILKNHLKYLSVEITGPLNGAGEQHAGGLGSILSTYSLSSFLQNEHCAVLSVGPKYTQNPTIPLECTIMKSDRCASKERFMKPDSPEAVPIHLSNLRSIWLSIYLWLCSNNGSSTNNGNKMFLSVNLLIRKKDSLLKPHTI